LELVGQYFAGYKILSLLGRGGTAEVYKAFQPPLKREVAIKILLQEVSHDLDWVRRFKQEWELLGRLDHPHILPIYEAGEHDGRLYLVMKYMSDATTLRSQLTGQPWPLNRVVKVVKQVADALDAAHKAGVVHRDIKPSNILVTPDLRCHVFDFGIAKGSRREENTTGSGLIVGTPEFMSPEQCKGEKIDHRSDVYSLGVMTYQMLTGHVPFSAETAVGILMKHLTDPLPIPPRGVALPPAINGVLRKAMARDPRERFSTAGELREAFERSSDQRPTVTLHATDIRRATMSTLRLPGWIRAFRKRELRLAMAGGVLVGMMTMIYLLWPGGQPTPANVMPPVEAIDPVVGRAAETETFRPDATSDESATQPLEAPPVEPRASTTTVEEIPLATLRIHTNARARVLLDGRLIGSAPGVFDAIPTGRHIIALDAGQGRMQEQSIVVAGGSTELLRFDFPATAEDASSTALEPVDPLTTAAAARARQLQEPPDVRLWTGFLTDEDCGVTGGKQGELHLRCAERCIREGKQPMLYSRGRLYRLDGLDRIDIVRDGPLKFRGWLEVDTIHVVDTDS
jgi:hypothetical protein